MAKMDREFQDWLNRNQYGNYNGYEIVPQTELVSYTYVISAVVMSFRHSTRYYFKEVEKGKAMTAKILCILCNLICGWWGIPWGPIWVIKETFCDLTDSYTQYWGAVAGRPTENEGIFDDMGGQKEEITQKAPKKKKIKTRDLIIYILIGLVVGIACIVAEFMGYF